MNARDVKKYYDEDYHGAIHGNLLSDDDYYWARAKAFHRLYFSDETNLDDLKVLDYGCGLGQASVCLRNASGYDASLQARDFCRKRGMTVFDEPEDIPTASFDVVICRHVLEHVPDPFETMLRIASYLKPSGRLKLILPKERHGRVPLAPDQNLHLFSWNFRSINNLLSLTGFSAKKNLELYHWGFSKLMPVRRWLGDEAYLAAAKLIGVSTRTAELYVEAEKTPPARGTSPA